MPWLIVLVLLLIPAPAQAGELGLMLGSYHFDRDRIEDVNESNPGLYWRGDDWTLGGFVNSYSEDSFFVARNWAIGKGWEAFIGAASGYEADDRALGGGVVPLAGLSWRYGPLRPLLTPDAIIATIAINIP